MRRLIYGAVLAALVSLDVNAVPWYGAIGFDYEQSNTPCPSFVYTDFSHPLENSRDVKKLQVALKQAVIDDAWNGYDKFMFLNYLAQKYPYIPIEDEFFKWDLENPVPRCVGYGQRDW